MNLFLAIVIGYLFGNIQAAFLFGKFSQGIDIREKVQQMPEHQMR